MLKRHLASIFDYDLENDKKAALIFENVLSSSEHNPVLANAITSMISFWSSPLHILVSRDEAIDPSNETSLKVHVFDSRFHFLENAEVKIMPNTASERALERLRLKNCVEEAGCTIELKEVGKGDKVKPAYEIKTQRQSKVLGLFKAKMDVEAQVDAETGELIKTKKPWWAFLASEPAEE